MSRAKGGRNRRKVESYYRSLGYIVANVEKTGRWTKQKDLFSDDKYTDSGFDSFAMNEDEILLIQVKSNVPAVREWYLNFAKQYACSHLKVIVATWIDRKGLRIQNYLSDGTIEEDFIISSKINKLIK